MILMFLLFFGFFFSSNFRKQELYSLEWGDLIDLSKFVIAAAPYGGPLGMLLCSLCL